MSNLSKAARKIPGWAAAAGIAGVAAKGREQQRKRPPHLRRHTPVTMAAVVIDEAAIDEARMRRIEAMLPDKHLAQVETAVDRFGYELVSEFTSREGRLPEDRDDLIAVLVADRLNSRLQGEP